MVKYSKPSDKLMNEISLRKNSQSYGVIADQLGVCRSTIQSFVRKFHRDQTNVNKI